MAMVWYSVFLPPVQLLINKLKVESMKKRTTKNIQPEPMLNSERQTIDTTSRQTIANTNVVGSTVHWHSLVVTRSLKYVFFSK